MLKFGSRAICTRCGQEIEWLGRATGWTDRGGNRECVAYFGRKLDEIVKPKAGFKHTIREVKSNV